MVISSRIIIGGLLGGTTAFFAGWIIFGQILFTFFEHSMLPHAGLMKDPMHPGIREWIALTTSQLALGLLLAFAFSKFSSVNLIRGMIAGALMVSLAGLWVDGSIFFQMNLIGKKYIFVNAAANLVYGGLTGAVTGWYIGKKTIIRT